MRKVSALLLAAERRAISGLAGLYASRMLGLFMVLPVLALYVDTLTGATPLLVGVALGIYGVTQATLQIPFGLLSDRIGRKRVIAMGLVIFALGSVVAALSDPIAGVIAGRALQGGGAVAAKATTPTGGVLPGEPPGTGVATTGAATPGCCPSPNGSAARTTVAHGKG